MLNIIKKIKKYIKIIIVGLFLIVLPLSIFSLFLMVKSNQNKEIIIKEDKKIVYKFFKEPENFIIKENKKEDIIVLLEDNDYLPPQP